MTYMFYKPRGLITANRDAHRPTVFDCFPPAMCDTHFAVGRLDRDTEGLLLITDDGPLCAALLHPSHHVPKTYEFYAIGVIDEEKITHLTGGLSIDEGRSLTRPAVLSVLSVCELGDILPFLSPADAKRARNHLHTPVVHATLTVTEGKKHQVRRMLRAVLCHIVWLKRISMGTLSLDGTLSPGIYRPLTEEEEKSLRSSARVAAER